MTPDDQTRAELAEIGLSVEDLALASTLHEILHAALPEDQRERGRAMLLAVAQFMRQTCETGVDGTVSVRVEGGRLVRCLGRIDRALDGTEFQVFELAKDKRNGD